MMSISGTSASRNCDPAQIVSELSGFVDTAVRDGISMRDFERGLFDRLVEVGFQLTEEFLDCGQTWRVYRGTGLSLHVRHASHS
jgi:hypothetical protein